MRGVDAVSVCGLFKCEVESPPVSNRFIQGTHKWTRKLVFPFRGQPQHRRLAEACAPAPWWSARRGAVHWCIVRMEFVGEPKFMQRSIPAAMKAVQGPPSWSKMAGDANVDARFRNNSTRHFEQRHFNKWQLDMKKEADLGLMPAEWSVSSAMNDPRPNGRAMFDARFVESPVGRARGGHAMVWDAKGTAHAGGTQKAKNISVEDIADAMEEKGAGLMHHGCACSARRPSIALTCSACLRSAVSSAS